MEQAHQWMPYCGAAPGPQEWLWRWNTDPVLALALLIGAIALWVPRLRPVGMDTRQQRALRAGWIAVVLLYVSPLCALSSTFFTVRVVHHMALVFVLAPLLVLGLGRSLRSLALPTASCTLVAAGTFWFWHGPGAYAAALSSTPVYWLMQLSLLATATAFWAALRRAGPAVSLTAILASTVLMGLLGALIAFATRPLYAPHFASTIAWGVTPLEDQQLAGIVMWAPGSLGYLGAALWIGWRWMRAERDRHPLARPA
ncbi:cytochrome c oxidase assembly protein [Aquabacterium sp. J223]|uniref:cytochrome c oxidase assembly protein n=1 Tax=Aquabacterium sp. J223 TaxID=2898431 RepID=UPI0021ADF635|nr:cytochrome c oxidase assembly protein [Aquabacterium sp. J223]UUX95249.1 cytochrome c oxidase assembly protein [Aquabacterium sp. J223]